MLDESSAPSVRACGDCRERPLVHFVAFVYVCYICIHNKNFPIARSLLLYHAHIHTRTRACVHTHTNTYTNTHTHTHTHIHIHIHTHTHTHTRTHTRAKPSNSHIKKDDCNTQFIIQYVSCMIYTYAYMRNTYPLSDTHTRSQSHAH